MQKRTFFLLIVSTLLLIVLSACGSKKFTVTFKDHDGTVLKTEEVKKGEDATAPANPTREGYQFSEW